MAILCFLIILQWDLICLNQHCKCISHRCSLTSHKCSLSGCSCDFISHNCYCLSYNYDYLTTRLWTANLFLNFSQLQLYFSYKKSFISRHDLFLLISSVSILQMPLYLTMWYFYFTPYLIVLFFKSFVFNKLLELFKWNFDF